MDDLRGNENRARIEKAGVQNRMSPANAVPPTAADASGVVGRPMGPGILGPNGMTSDSHRNQRHSNNLANPAPEKSREKYAEEIRRRLHSPARDVKYR